MAHYIAELIQDAEKALAEERPEKMRACCDAILNLWKHRQTLPDGRRPFLEMEPMLRTLASLDPENSTPRYFRSVRTAAEDAKETDEAISWLQLIDDLDYSARILIRYGLTQAAQKSLNKSMEWVGLAEAAGADEGVEFPLVRIIIQEGSVLEASDPNEEEKKLLENRIGRLRAFSKMALAVASCLQKEVQPAQASGRKKGSKKKTKKAGMG